MSEYWKSVPKYWCKFCKVYVRDTPLEKKQHDSTARHQGSIQKSLRDLHKVKEREDRDVQRAKDEVARLNGLTAGPGSVAKATPVVTREVKKAATADDRKRQMAQLAAMGVAIPEEYRSGVAMAGDWQTISRRTAEAGPKVESSHALTSAEKKRKMKDRDEQEEEEQEEIPANRKGWGRALKKFPTDRKDDLDSLLGGTILLKKEETDPQEGGDIKNEQDNNKEEKLPVKAEPMEDTSLPEQKPAVNETKPMPPPEDALAPPVVFKKRKAKPIK